MNDPHPHDARFARIADLVIDVAREIRLRSGVDAPLNQTQSQVMRAIHASPGCTVSHIAAASGIKRTNVSAAVQELRQLGYAEVSRDPDDRRAVRVQPTAKAQATIAELNDAWAAMLSDAWASAGSTDDPDATEAGLAALMRGLRSTRDTRPGGAPPAE